MSANIISDDEIAKKIKKHLKDLPIKKKPYSPNETAFNSKDKKPQAKTK